MSWTKKGGGTTTTPSNDGGTITFEDLAPGETVTVG
jgi:hypothetical protein